MGYLLGNKQMSSRAIRLACSRVSGRRSSALSTHTIRDYNASILLMNSRLNVFMLPFGKLKRDLATSFRSRVENFVSRNAVQSKVETSNPNSNNTSERCHVA
jgi:hypothetical protein